MPKETAVEITEVRIKLVADNNERLQAFCSVTFDDAFVVRDVKIIEGGKGSFVAMPSRKLADRCSHCGYKNH
jgi:stage V sporulation protein G